ncbi:YqiA/YcfP family alpha/beta fold hydrolase [Hydrogenovibrio kuenenii]|uniref:YqiA/YcfP family alpha/beta fold hydrolase n=1 Tax=Hydrogenovibrio kuenenii TaxID=63658 RepID=UPI0004646D2E|nr:YqiA/YcfP family alpha/beta fold hydrolase [Hydrogenovibrio kuenenii]
MILYLHGFLSTGKSYKAQWFKKAFAELGIEVLTPTYPLASPEKTIAYLKSVIEEDILKLGATPAWQIFGSSMGGFYGEYLSELYGVPLVMINPALNPVSIFKQHYGEYEHPITGERFVIDDDFIEAIEKLITQNPVSAPSRLLLDKEDETVPYEFAYQKYQNVQQSKTLAFEGGDHAFQHLEDAWQNVKTFVEGFKTSG